MEIKPTKNGHCSRQCPQYRYPYDNTCGHFANGHSVANHCPVYWYRKGRSEGAKEESKRIVDEINHHLSVAQEGPPNPFRLGRVVAYEVARWVARGGL